MNDVAFALSFTDVVAAVERIGANRGAPQVIRLYREWIAQQPPGTPLLFAAWFNLGVELDRAGDREGSMQAYHQALALKPDLHAAAVNLGLAWEALGRPEAALAVYAGALQPDDARVALLNNRGRLLEQVGLLDEAETTLHRSLLLDPAQPDVVQHWVHLRQKLCRWPVLAGPIPGLDAATMLRQAGPVSALALTDSIALQGAVAGGFIARKTRPAAPLAPAEGYRHERIRVGYLSSDFCSHAMSYLIAELFERHDRAGFEVFGYCASPEDGSAIRRRVVAAFDHFRPIRDLTDQAAAERIRADEIDILVDLNGLTTGARLQLLRHRPAPVQATYLGFVGPVPLPELDYLFCDEEVIPPELAAGYAPAPCPIGPLFQANDGRRVVAAPMPRAAAGLPEGRLVFCSHTGHFKITESLFAAWMAILARTGDSVLWLVADNAWSCASLRAAAARHGVDPERLIFAPKVAPDTYLARLACADLFLDTFPYNAGTVASDAIRAGLPLVTLQGEAFASRMAARLLRAIGAEEGIATSLEDYVARAVTLANDRTALAAYRTKFGPTAWQAGLGDVEGFTRAYEATLRRIVRRP